MNPANKKKKRTVIAFMTPVMYQFDDTSVGAYSLKPPDGEYSEDYERHCSDGNRDRDRLIYNGPIFLTGTHFHFTRWIQIRQEEGSTD